MQIILAEDEIMEALEAYVRERITLASNQTINIDLKAGRGENGFTATLDIKTNKANTPPDLPNFVKGVAPAEPLPVDMITKTVKTIIAEPVVAAVEETPAISTGEERIEPEVQSTEEAAAEPAPKKAAGIFANALKAEEPAPEEEIEEAPAAKPVNSIFNFKNKTGA